MTSSGESWLCVVRRLPFLVLRLSIGFVSSYSFGPSELGTPTLSTMRLVEDLVSVDHMERIRRIRLVRKDD